MAEQDNRGTRAPYFYVIRSKREYAAPVDNCERIIFRDEDSDCNYESEEECRVQMAKDGCALEDIKKL